MKNTTNVIEEENIIITSVTFFNISYVPSISEQFGPLVRDLNTIMSYTCLNKLSRFIRVQKDKLTNEMRNNIVYKISYVKIVAHHMSDKRADY